MSARRESAAGEPRRPFLEHFALHRPELRAWALYDWANSAFFTVVVAALFPIYFKEVVAAERTDVLGIYTVVTSVSMLAMAVIGPLLGALSDVSAGKKRFLAAFVALGVASTAALFFAERGDWLFACIAFALGNVGVAGSFVFYDALLPSIAREGELDRISSAGYALGYLGGGLLLALNVAWIRYPDWFGLPSDSTLPVRLAFLSVAAWWLLFSLPLFARVPEPRPVRESDEPAGTPALRTAVTRLWETLRELRRYRQAFLLLVAMLIYNDGITTIIRMAVLYGKELELATNSLVLAILLVQFVGFPCAFAFGWLARFIGAKRAILCGLAAYVVITLIAWRMDSVAEFYALAIGVGMVQGGCQALSRSLFASMVPAHKSGEFFGLFGVLERFSSVLGPMVFGLTIQWTGSKRAGMLPLILFFAVGAWLLSRVDVESGRRAAREATGLE